MIASCRIRDDCIRKDQGLLYQVGAGTIASGSFKDDSIR